MASNCNNVPASNLCQTCATPNLNNGCSVGCLDIYTTSCIQYDGANLVCSNIPTGSFLNDALCSINNLICQLDDNLGLVKVDINDQFPDTLSNKLLAGSNIVLTGIGSGDSKQIRIDAIVGGQIVDQLVKVSAIDQSSGYLDDKLIVGPCMYIQKVNPGLNEKLQVLIDWQCALNQLSQLPGFCTLVNNCIPNVPTITCPYILLNNPSISGSTLTATWLSSGASFNVYIDGTLQPNMPTSSLTYTTSNLSNGSHNVEVVALCNSGTPQRDNQTFLINTACPVPNQLSVGISSGNASISWMLDSNSNNQSQTVQYKLNTASNYSTASSVSSIATSSSITGLQQNRLYNFQIVNNCLTGGPSPSTSVTAIEFTCPNVNLTSTSNSVTYSFVGLNGDIDTYVATLLDSTGINIIQTKQITGPFSPTVGDIFTGLNSNTTYQVKLTVKAGAYSKDCNAQTITTPNIPSCPTASNFIVTLS